jgi:hypothetical protein
MIHPPCSTQHRGYQAPGRGLERQGDAGWGVAMRDPTHERFERIWFNNSDGIRESRMVIVPVNKGRFGDVQP